MKEKRNTSRLGVVIMFFGIAVLLIVWRYLSLMLLTPKDLENPAQRPVVERGAILDRNGRILAIQTELDSSNKEFMRRLRESQKQAASIPLPPRLPR